MPRTSGMTVPFEDYGEAWKVVECVQCGHPAGQPCITRNGQIARQTHQRRVVMFRNRRADQKLLDELNAKEA